MKAGKFWNAAQSALGLPNGNAGPQRCPRFPSLSQFLTCLSRTTLKCKKWQQLPAQGSKYPLQERADKPHLCIF